MKALSPAKVKEVRIVHETGTAEVVVPDYQLSVAIGKEGQNARLAARLTGWRVDIKSESQLFEEEQNPVEEEWAAGEWITDDAGQMVWQPAEGGEAVSASEAGWGDLEGVTPAAEAGAEAAAVEDGAAEPVAETAGDGEAEEKIDESIHAGEVDVETPAAATVVADAGE